jgi:hypothetical protein
LWKLYVQGQKLARRVRATDVKNTADNTMDRWANASVISQVKPKHSLGSLAVIRKLKYVGLIMRTSDYIEKDLMFGLTDGSRRGRHRTRWTAEIQRTLTMNWHDINCHAKRNADGGTWSTRPWKSANDETSTDHLVETSKGWQYLALHAQKLE